MKKKEKLEKKKVKVSWFETRSGTFLRSEKTTSILKVKKNLEKFAKCKKQKVVLMATGSFNPVHNMHIEMFDIVKRFLEKEKKFRVVGGFISPSFNSHVYIKLGKSEAIHSKHRIKLVELAIASSKINDWLCVDKAEAQHDKFSGHASVLKTLKMYLDEKFPKEKIRVIWICGRDLYQKCCAYRHTWVKGKDYGMCVLDREVSNRYKQKEGLFETLLSKDKENVWLVKEKIDEKKVNLSSSMIRYMMKNGVKIDEEMVYKPVIDYLKKNKDELYTISPDEWM